LSADVIIRNKQEAKASFQHKLATFYFIQKRYDLSEKWYLSALQIRTKVLSGNHPDTIKTLSCLSILYKQQGKYKEAVEYYKKYIAVVGQSDNDALAALRECEEALLKGGNNNNNDDLVSLWGFSKIPHVYDEFRKLTSLSSSTTASTGLDTVDNVPPPLTMEILRKIAGKEHVCKAEEGKLIDRTPASKEAYEAHKARLAAQGISIKEYITKDVFSNDLDSKPWVLTKNAFPYKLESNIMHLVMWHNSPERNMEGLKAVIEEVFQGSDYVWFANAEELMSVPVYFHGQVFVKI